MKKTLITLFAGILLFQGGLTFAATSETASLFSGLKDAIVKDVQNVVTTNAQNAINAVQLSNYKKQLATKKQELKDLEASNTNAFIKYFKRISLNRKIAELEANIAALEKPVSSTETKTESK
ncbi:hypothetical protein IJ670_01635 [bacterium]|nr:hypothetical protein [bacterium]